MLTFDGPGRPCANVIIAKSRMLQNVVHYNFIASSSVARSFLASLVAVFGEFDISGELETRRSVTKNVRRVIVNRGYDPATFENDLALLELESPVQFDDHIVPICMPNEGIDFTGRMATVTGWGRLKYSEYRSHRPRFANFILYRELRISPRAAEYRYIHIHIYITWQKFPTRLESTKWNRVTVTRAE